MIIDSEIYHHGVKGMKWGVRKNDSGSSNSGAQKESKNLGDGGASFAAVGIVYGGMFAAVKMNQSIQSGGVRRVARKGKSALTFKDPTDFPKNDKLAQKDLSVDQLQNLVVKPINPNFGARGTKMNCRRCTFSYEMRRRGYDVKSVRSTNAEGANAVGLLNALSPGEKLRKTTQLSVLRAKQIEASSANKPITKLMDNHTGGSRKKIANPDSNGIFAALDKEPNGSRGELAITMKGAGGHSVVYERVKGKTVIFDTQSGKAFRNPAEFRKDSFGDQLSEAGYTRLDNVQLNHDFLMKWVRNA